MERDEAWDIGMDAMGNIYMGGWFDSDAISFGSGISAVNSSAGQNGNAFLVKFSPDGTPLWSRSAGGSGNSDWAWAMAADPAGGAVIGGEFYSTTMQFGPGVSLTNTGLSTAFIARYDSDGNVQWARKIGESGTSSVYGLAVDASGRVYATGAFEASVTFAGSILSSLGGDDLFLAVYDQDGNELWARSMGGSQFVSGTDVAVGPSGDVYVTGRSFSPDISFAGSTQTNAGLSDLFVLRYSATGAELGWFYAGASDSEEASSVAVDSEGRVYVTGSFWSNPLSFGPFTLISSGEWDSFLGRFTADLTPIWVRKGGGSGSDRAEGFAISPQGDIALAGEAGTPPTTFGSLNVPEQGILHVGYDSLGNTLWAEANGGILPWFDRAASAAFTPEGDLVLAGTFSSSTIDFGGGVSLSRVGSISVSDLFAIRRRSPLGLQIVEQPISASLCEGDSAIFSVVSQGDLVSYQWGLNGNPITGATGSQLVIFPVSEADAGVYRCAVIGSCETLFTNPVLLEVKPRPDQPVLQLNATADSLQALGPADQFLWTLNGIVLPETGSTLALSGPGTYTAQAFLGNCSGPVSQPFMLTGLLTTDVNLNPPRLWPNPGSHFFHVQFASDMPADWTYGLFNSAGAAVLRGTVPRQTQPFTVSPGALPPGLYTFVMTSEWGVQRAFWVVQ